jgi:hypothetical protein
LNDLQLIVQYENFIVHSYVDGDQSEFHLSLLNTEYSLMDQATTPGANSAT